MRAYLQRSVEAALRQILPADDAETALSWWIASEGRAPVVIVGAGFTRNARDRVTGRRVASAHVPLWVDMLRRFQEDLGRELEGLDALTIAELHAEALGPRRHVDVLLEMLPDERLVLGPAHDAIFDLRPVAIVTTNFLDTVLDQHPRAAPIFDDASAAARIDPLERTEIVYLHGHRSAPATWVLTRSQYDRLEESRPILLTRVRQLFAQHPILTVGFSLADPDFHQIQGQINARMAGYQPLGLTLLGPLGASDQTSRRESALRSHWAKRNLRIVRFKEECDFEIGLSEFLRLPGKMEIALCEKFLRDERSFRKRVELARSVLHDGDAEKRIEAEYGWQERIWRTCLEADFSEAEHNAIRERWNAAVQASAPRPVPRASASDPSTPGRTGSLGLSTPLLNDGPGYQLWELAWLCDGWWGSGRDKVALVDWLHERIVHPDWPTDGSRSGSDIRIAELLILLVESLPTNTKAKDDARARDGMRLLRRYDPQTAARLAEKFAELRDHARPGPADPHHDVHRQMAEGFAASMNGDHARATEAYHRAFEAAQRASDPLGLWLAARSRCVANDLQDRGPIRGEGEERSRQARRYLAEDRETQRHPKVADWHEAADRRLLELRKVTIEDLQRESRRRAFEGMHMRITDVIHLAWRTLRDLEEVSAHPILQRHYLRPLLDHGFGDVAAETTYRLTFDIDRFREWSRQIIEDEASHDRAVYDQRSEALVSAWLALATNEPSISALVGCIKGVESLSLFVRTDDVDKIGRVLADAPKALALGAHDPAHAPDTVRTFSGTVDTTAALARAWAAWLGMRGRPEDFAAFKAWADTRRPRDLFDAFDGVHRLRWESLVRAGVSIDDAIAWLCTSERLGWLKTAHIARFREPFGTVLWRLAAVRPESVSVKAWISIAEAAASLLPESAAAMVDANGLADGDDLVRAGFGVLAAWERGGDGPVRAREKPAALSALRSRLEQLVAPFFVLRADERHAGLMLAQLAVAADVLRFDRTVAASELQALNKKLNADWPRVIAFCKDNPGEVRHAADFLAAVVESTTESSSAGAQGKILELVELSSSALDGLSRILDPKLWAPGTWTKLAQSLREASSGARGRFAGTARTNLCDLVRHALLHTRQPLPAELRSLAQGITDLTAHEDATVANHAAYATAMIAECGIAATDSDLAKEMAQTIRSIAKDPRPGVRGAAAYALGSVGGSTHAVIRDLVGALAWLGGDPYAHVRSEWWHGQQPRQEVRNAKKAKSSAARKPTKK